MLLKGSIDSLLDFHKVSFSPILRAPGVKRGHTGARRRRNTYVFACLPLVKQEGSTVTSRFGWRQRSPGNRPTVSQSVSQWGSQSRRQRSRSSLGSSARFSGSVSQSCERSAGNGWMCAVEQNRTLRYTLNRTHSRRIRARSRVVWGNFTRMVKTRCRQFWWTFDALCFVCHDILTLNTL